MKKITKLLLAVALTIVLAFSLMGAKTVSDGVSANECNLSHALLLEAVEFTQTTIAPLHSFPYVEIRFSRFSFDSNTINFDEIMNWLEFAWSQQQYFELHFISGMLCAYRIANVIITDDFFSFIVCVHEFSNQWWLYWELDFMNWNVVSSHWAINLADIGIWFESFSAMGFRYWFGGDGNSQIIAELLAIINSLNSQISSLHSQLSHANSLLNSANVNVNNLTNAVNNLTSELNYINMQLQNALDMINELEADNEEVAEQIDGLNELVAGLENDIANLESEISYLEGVIDGKQNNGGNGNSNTDGNSNNNFDDENFTTARILVAVVGLLLLILIISLIGGLIKRKGRRN